ncbi:nuclease, partial [Klebsiella pneumoniae]|nr:nuclease [Klebsiella pneumoniae]
MIVGFSRHGTGGGGGPVGYVTDKTRPGRENSPPEVLRGSPEATRNLIDSLDFRHKYTSGVLSFAPEEKVTPEMEQEFMDRFEQVAFAGLEADQYNILWVRHTHA